MRPEFITDEDIYRWSILIDNDDTIPKEFSENTYIREIMYAGLFLVEELEKLHCPKDLLIRIQWNGGKLSFGRNPWQVHMKLIEDYKLDRLTYASDINEN